MQISYKIANLNNKVYTNLDFVIEGKDIVKCVQNQLVPIQKV